MKPRSIVAGYLLFQATATAAWWLLMWRFPVTIDWFKPTAWPRETVLGFWLGDFTMLIAGSLLTAAAVLLGDRRASLAIWSLAAAAWYPTLTCIGVSILTGQAWIAAGLMACLAGLSLAMATIYGTGEQSPATIREMEPDASGSLLETLLWTVAQTVIFWSVFLWILPLAIVELEQKLGGPTFQFGGQTSAALSLLTAASLLGFWSAVTMATAGQGTPLPTATAPRLVTSGPYRFVRNSMAVAGILQGIAVGCLLGSYAVIAYALLGAVVWHLLVRPIEEHDLQQRFGESYLQYQQKVGLWTPRLWQAK